MSQYKMLNICCNNNIFEQFSNTNSLGCVLMSNQKCKARPKIIDFNNNEPVLSPYSIKVNKFGGRCNGINDPYAKLCVPNIARNMNLKVFNLMSKINETRSTILHEICKCVCRLTSAVCNSRQIWNEDKCNANVKKI